MPEQTENKYYTLFNRYINTNIVKTGKVSANNSGETHNHKDCNTNEVKHIGKFKYE